MKRDLIAENWRLEKSRYALMGNVCDNCGAKIFPRRTLCPKCHSDNLQEHIFSNRGKIIEWTRIYEPASGFELYAPYYFGIIELDEGIRVSTQITSITDESQLEVGKEVQLVFRKLFEGGPEGVIAYGFKAEPIIE